MKDFTVLDLLSLDLKEHNDLELECVSGRKGLGNVIEEPDLNRPGLALSGFFDNFGYKRIQIIGRGEYAYIQKLVNEKNLDNLKDLYSNPVPCTVFTHGMEPPEEYMQIAEEHKSPLLVTPLHTSEFSVRIIRALSNIFAAQEVRHGVLVEVFGIGILILGKSSVGKSEAALELIERGHRLVADDAVHIKCESGNQLVGSAANKVIGHHMEIRGLGIINITHLFGVGAIRDKKQIQVIVELEVWDSSKNYDRIGANETMKEILGVHIPYLQVPVKPGRNIPILIETAAMNERLKKMGYYSAKEFNKSVMQWLESENARNTYLKTGLPGKRSERRHD